ncbi:hypothetical protein NQ317_013193 [Molorchus minor]|uniref:TFIIS N-terminal domain-containing protein n=1 Tax=Molorchus minor TaxID=1323400 RepID=A0ABQ9IWE0_9CUCU|nr:hypothetical protein NQ317_013193 [Molorchus minor]
MGVSNEELLKLIKYYQESFDRYTLNKNDYKILNAIEKLKKLPIATAHLEQTGIGRTVNALLKTWWRSWRCC